MPDEYLGAGVGLDTTAFKTGVTELKAQVKQIETSFRASAAVMGDWSKSTEGLSSRTASLEEKLKLQKQALATLNEEYRKTSTEQGSSSKAAQSLAGQMYSMEKQIQSTERDLLKFNAQLKLQQSGWESLHLKMKDVSEQAKAIGKGFSDAGKTVSTAFTVPIAGVAAAAVKLGNDFEAQMSRVKAISGATGDEFQKLNEQALKLGADTAFSATEAAEGMENLASAGFNTQEIMKAMPGMLDLAASSGEDLANSADIAASTLRGFGLAADQAGHVADVLAKNAADTNAAIEDTGLAMKYIAPVAYSAGWSLESVTAAIGKMADAGIKGEQAGTTLRGALTRLMKPTKQMQGAMDAIGFSVYDSQGKMKPLAQMIDELNKKTKKLTDEQRDNAVATIFGTESLSGMKVLLSSGGAELNKMTESLKKSDGAAKNMASTMQGNTKGAIEQMKGSLETAAIQIQQALAPTITKAANAVQELANKFSALSPAQQEMILKIAAVVAAVGPILLIVGKLVTGIGAIAGFIGTVSGAIAVVTTGAAAATPAIAGLAGAIKLVGIAFKFMTGPIGIAIAVIGIAVAAFIYLWNNCEGFRNFWTGLWNGIKSTAQAVGNWFAGPFVDFFKGAWNGITGFFSGLPGWFSNLWDSIVSGVTRAWEGLKGGISNAMAAIQAGLTTAWNAIVGVVVAIVQPFVNGILDFWRAIQPGLSSIMTGVKNIFSGAWEIIKNVVLGPVLLICDLVTGNFSALGSDMAHLWENIRNGAIQVWTGLQQYFFGILGVIVGIFSTAWNHITANVQAAWNAIVSFFISVFNTLRTVIVNAWNGYWNAIFSVLKTMKSGILNVWDSVLNWFRNLPGTLWTIGSNMFTAMKNGVNSTVHTVVTAVKSGIGSAVEWIKNLPSEALQWGKDIIYGIVDGIKRAASAVRDAVNGVAQSIRSFLHFSVPDEGPLTDYESWMPDFMTGLARGIEKSKYKVRNAIQALSTDISVGVNPRPGAPVPAFAGAGGNSTVNNYSISQTIQGAKDTSAAENYRQMRDLARQLNLKRG